MRTPAMLLPFLLLGSGCVMDSAVAPPGPACEGKCDGASPAPIVQCFVAPDPAADPFYRADTLLCRLSEAASPVPLAAATIELHTASGVIASDRLSAPGIFSLPALRTNAYPIELEVTLSLADVAIPGLRSLAFQSASETLTIASAAEATPEAPKTIVLPFELWRVRVANNSQATSGLHLRHGLGGLEIDEFVPLYFGTSTEMFVPVPTGAVALPVTLTADPAVAAQLEGPGSYEVTADGRLVHADVPTDADGDVTALCSRAVQQLGSQVVTDVRCSPVSDTAAVDMVLVLEPSAGAPVTLALTETQAVSFEGEVDTRVTLRATVRDEVADLATLRERTFAASAVLTSMSPDVAARLPFRILRTRWIVDAEAYAFVQFPEVQLDLGAHGQTTVVVPERSEAFSPGTTTDTFVVAPASAPRTASGLVAPVANGPTLENVALALDHAVTYRVTTAGFAPQ